ncbi:ABC transporter substrate-binding protein [Salinarimonas rosea]|uniref:ABC transporter substrate-binding protein n=1 Tax=Salinarimonas rosea TaxID=552063 RepID=UPI000421E32F|nr:ABC transporter substrate-binding protein [Salinarimonas rosea]
MGCCDDPFTLAPSEPLPAGSPNVNRRGVLKGFAAAAGSIAALAGAKPARAQARAVRLAFCSQLLCIIPYEVARAKGRFAEQGLEVELVYTRGGNAAMQALVGGAVDYAATSLDVAMQAFARGAPIRRFATTGQLPLFALATAPARADEIGAIEDLAGRTVGVSALGNADHALMLYLLERAGVEPTSVQFATLGPNILEALRQGQIDAGLVQEPALTLVIEAGGRTLVNAMDVEDAQRFLGGPYEFMGVAVRADELEERREEMRKLALGLRDGLGDLQQMSPDELVATLPSELTTGGNLEELARIIERYRESLYPQDVAIDLEAAQRVAATLAVAGLVPADLVYAELFDTSIVEGG